MPKRPDSELNFDPLDKLVKKASVKKLTVTAALNSGKFAQIGFGMFRETDNNSIWQVETGTDGVDYISRMVEKPTEVIAESEGEWTAVADSEKENVTLAHKGTPICKFASKDYGFDASNIKRFARLVVVKAQNPEFIQKIRNK